MSAIQQLWDQHRSLHSCIQTPSKISLKNISTYCSLPCQVLLPSPWHCLFTITNSNSMPLVSISVVLSSQTLFLLFFYFCIITTCAPFTLQTLFFSTHIDMPRMYQYSLSLILKLFLSYSFMLLAQSLKLIITTNSSQTLTLMPNPSYAEKPDAHGMRNMQHAWWTDVWTPKQTHTQPSHTSLLYVHRVSSSSSLGILLNTKMLCRNRSSTELIGFANFSF